MIEFITTYQIPLIILGILIIMGFIGYLAEQNGTVKSVNNVRKGKNIKKEKKIVKEVVETEPNIKEEIAVKDETVQEENDFDNDVQTADVVTIEDNYDVNSDELIEVNSEEDVDNNDSANLSYENTPVESLESSNVSVETVEPRNIDYEKPTNYEMLNEDNSSINGQSIEEILAANNYDMSAIEGLVEVEEPPVSEENESVLEGSYEPTVGYEETLEKETPEEEYDEGIFSNKEKQTEKFTSTDSLQDFAEVNNVHEASDEYFGVNDMSAFRISKPQGNDDDNSLEQWKL